MQKRYLALGIIAIVLIASITYILLSNNKPNNPYGLSVELKIWINGKLVLHKFNDLIKFNFGNLTAYLHGYHNATFIVADQWYYGNYTYYINGKYSVTGTCLTYGTLNQNVFTTTEAPRVSSTTDLQKWYNPLQTYSYQTPVKAPFLIGLNVYSSAYTVSVAQNKTLVTNNAQGCADSSLVFADVSTSAFGYIKNSTTRFGYYYKQSYVNPSNGNFVFNDTKLYLPFITIGNIYNDGAGSNYQVSGTAIFVNWLLIAEDKFSSLTMLSGDTATIQYIIWFN